jgi:hypothetical protein
MNMQTTGQYKVTGWHETRYDALDGVRQLSRPPSRTGSRATSRATRAEWFVVPGSATGQLVGLSGTGGYTAREGTTCDVELTVDLP